MITETELDKHMGELCREYAKASSTVQPNNQEIYHLMNKIKANHLIFTRLQRSAFKYLFDRGLVFFVDAGKYVYQKKRASKNNVYFVLYGELEYRLAGDDTRFGDRVTIGFSVGEETLFEKPFVARHESVAATVKSCLLQIDAKDLLNMAKRPSDGGGSTAYREDREMLMDLCKQFYYIKSLWRQDEGLVETPKMMEPWLK